MILIKLLWIFLNFLVACIHADMINKGKGRDIRHSLWGAGFFIVAGLFGWLFWKNGATVWDTVWLGFDFLLTRKVVFDLSLNARRKGPYAVPLFYITPEVKSINFSTAFWKGKLWDWLHWKVWKEGVEVCYIIYALASILFSIYFLSRGYEPFTKNNF